MLDKHKPSLIWETSETRRYTNLPPSGTKVNMLKMGTLWTSKEGLCNATKTLHWFQNDVDVKVPRTYKSHDDGEIDDFIDDYKLTACSSLLRWFLDKNKINIDEIISSDGNTPAKTIVFAINRCKEFLLNKEHKFLDKHKILVSNKSWNLFLKYYYRLIVGCSKFEESIRQKVMLYTAYAELILDEMEPHRQQIKCEGYRNIWILKPADASRGFGIRMASKLGVLRKLFVESKQKYIAQKYIEDPLLIYEAKFDIRQHFLVTRTVPLAIWMYKDCYLKFSSQRYSLDNYNESIHLTNNAVQRKYLNGQRNTKLPQENMWSLSEFKNYLSEYNMPNAWDDKIYSAMKHTIIAVMLSCQELMLTSKNQFELFGCDFILDKDCNPWLIEINSFPDMKHTTQVTAKLCPNILEDVLKVVIDHENDPTQSTGNFECVYNQPYTKPMFANIAANLMVNGTSLRLDQMGSQVVDCSNTLAEGDITSSLCSKRIEVDLKNKQEVNFICC